MELDTRERVIQLEVLERERDEFIVPRGAGTTEDEVVEKIFGCLHEYSCEGGCGRVLRGDGEFGGCVGVIRCATDSQEERILEGFLMMRNKMVRFM